jgi:type VI secretion system protein ImpG
VALGPGSWEYHVVPDRTRPMDLEVHSIERVVGHGGGRSDGFDGPLEFKPLFASRYEPPLEGNGYYTVRRELRRLSERQRNQGARVPSYVGEEVFISLVDGRHGPFREGLKQLSVTAWVTNRDLPVLLPTAGQPGERVWQLDAPGPVTGVDCLRGPTRPVSRQPVGDIGWQLVTQVTQNHLELGDEPARAAAALRDLLRLYGPPNDVVWAHQVEGVHGLKSRQSVQRLPFPGPLSFGCGVEIELEIDEHSFQGASAFLLGSVLERFYARFAAINSFTQFTLRSQQRGVIKAWPARGGWGQIA